MGTHAVTQALVVTDVARRVHHERFHRFFSRGAWKPDTLGRLLFERIVATLCPQGRLVVALDDTLAPKKGPEVFGIGSHLDPVRSTKGFRVFSFGHVWVVLAVVVTVPSSSRRWALPVLLRLYRTRSECERSGHRYRKKTELGRQMVDVLVGWAVGRNIDVVVDNAYCNDTLTRGLSKQVTVIGALRPDAVLTAAPTDAECKRTGRRRKRGCDLPKPEQIYNDPSYPWHTAKLTLYGKQQSVISYKTLVAQWHRGAGVRPGRIVIVHVPHGNMLRRHLGDGPASRLVHGAITGSISSCVTSHFRFERATYLPWLQCLRQVVVGHPAHGAPTSARSLAPSAPCGDGTTTAAQSRARS